MSCSRKSILQRRIASGLGALVLSGAFSRTACASPQETILYRFGTDNSAFELPLVMDSNGALYSVSDEFQSGRGTIQTLFRLSPPAAPAKVWHFEALRRFSPQDQIEGVDVSYLAVAPNSNTLYGVTSSGGRCAPTSVETSCGTAFSLSPPITGDKVWGFDPIFRFGKAAVTANTPRYIVAGNDGALYGTSLYGIGTTAKTYGTVFKLNPPSTTGRAWSDVVLYSFEGGVDGAAGYILPPDGTGTIYGESSGGGCPSQGNFCGTFFKLVPPNDNAMEWTKTVLYTFLGGEDGIEPSSLLIADGMGGYYGLTGYGGGTSCFKNYGCGTVYRLMPPAAGATTWSETLIYRFKGGDDGALPEGVAVDQFGAIYGTTMGTEYGGPGLGTVWKLSPPADGGTKWIKTTLHHFQGGSDGSQPVDGLVIDKNGAIYGTTQGGGSRSVGGYGGGVIYKITQ